MLAKLTPPSHSIKGKWTLPPLIFHPFSGGGTEKQLRAGSEANLALSRIPEHVNESRYQLSELVLRGRVEEMRMLYFLGRDVNRWIEQCVDFANRSLELKTKGIRAQSFSAYLVECPPEEIIRKLELWGIKDPKLVFSRAIGLSGILTEVPDANTLTPLFLHHYHRYLDYLYVCYQNLEPFTELPPDRFTLQVYGSAEYSKMLEEHWGKEN